MKWSPGLDVDGGIFARDQAVVYHLRVCQQVQCRAPSRPPSAGRSAGRQTRPGQPQWRGAGQFPCRRCARWHHRVSSRDHSP
ncbi:MAG: hypothetical protein MZV64_33010 [Ignavibacteriales bacterium]|nr:hypothetical protein [Ignavibacteriales bacterium]